MKKNIRKARPTCMKKKKSELEIECIDIPDDDDDLKILYVHHPSGTFDDKTEYTCVFRCL